VEGHGGIRRSLAVAAVSAGLALTGCASATSTGSGMMGGAVASANPANGSGMMGSGSAYQYSRLTCAAPKSLPGHTVAVLLADMGMTQMTGGIAPLGSRMMLRVSATAEPAGQITLVATNMGWRTHELVILPLAAGVAAGRRIPGPDGKVSETGSLGEASSSCAAGTGDGIAAGTVGWTTVKLLPGRYELVCNLANHYADGMHQELVVTGIRKG
jgi:uncharacterized cupredoxin-like copper-binding protein